MTDIETYQINNAQIYDAIRWAYFDVLSKAKSIGIDTNNIVICMHPDIAEQLELGDNLTIGFGQFTFDVSVVRDMKVNKLTLTNDEYKSDILIYAIDCDEEQ